MTKSEFIEKARFLHGYKYEYPSLKGKVLSSDYIDVVFNGSIYSQKVVKHLLGRCPEKNTYKKTTEQFIKESIEIWGEKYDYSLTDYNGALEKVKIIYDGVVFYQIPTSHLSGQCVERNLNQESFIKKSKEVYGNRYDYTSVVFLSGDIEVMIGYCGVLYSQKPHQHLLGYRPENKKLSTKKTINGFISESDLVHDNKFIYDKVDYINNQTKVIVTCEIHGDFKITPISHLRGTGCPKCDLVGDKLISKFLKKYKVYFLKQYKFPECRNGFELPFDFFIPSMRTCIEFYEKQHYQHIDNFGIDLYEKLKSDDRTKMEYCDENYINLIIIKYYQIDDISKIMWDNLKQFIRPNTF